MSERTHSREWPLVVFTLALQLACGLALSATFLDRVVQNAAAARPIGMAVFPVVTIGLLASLLHVGRPLSAWKSLSNIPRSRLSREVLLSSAFAAAALVYSTVWFVGVRGMRSEVGIITSVLGVVAVLSSALIYTIPTQPFWNSGWLPASFFATTILLGGSASVLSMSRTSGSGTLEVVLASVLVASAGELFSATWALKRFLRLRGTNSDGQGQPGVTMVQGLCFVFHIVLAAILPAVFALRLWGAGTAAELSSAMPAILVAVLAGTALGRVLMYSLAEPLPRF